MERFLGRLTELGQLRDFSREKSSGFMYVRGRRRVGKSWLLKEFKKSFDRCFYFSGVADEQGRLTLKRFATEWDAIAETSLSQLRQSALNWSFLFNEIAQFAKRRRIVLIFDEIQWIAKKGSGFVGNLKTAWLDWEKTGHIKVIVCGSSNKFFHDYTDGEEKILRGLKTRSSLWVQPFSLSEVRRYFFPQWNLAETCLCHMMFGGIPYYLAQIDTKAGFIHAINQVAFTEGTIFLEEIDEILGVEFNKRGTNTVKKVLASLGQSGSDQKNIQIKTGISLAHLSALLERLVDFGLVFKKLPAHKKPVRNEGGYRYIMKDPFLNFYFQLLAPLQSQIMGNKSGLLFPYSCLQSQKGYYIPNFSGIAFELLIRHVLENGQDRKTGIFEKLQLLDGNYQVLDYWDNRTQIDLIVEHSKDRISRVIECKWVSGKIDKSHSYIDEIIAKPYQPPNGMQRRNFLVISQEVSESFRALALEKQVILIGLEDLFGPGVLS